MSSSSGNCIVTPCCGSVAAGSPADTPLLPNVQHIYLYRATPSALGCQTVAVHVQEMYFKAQRLAPEIIAVLDSFLQSRNMAVD